jgi:WD40 repeat protein
VQDIQFDKQGKSVALVNGGQAVVVNLTSKQNLFRRDFPQAYVEEGDRSAEESVSRVALVYGNADFTGLFRDLGKPEDVPLVDLTNVGGGAVVQSRKIVRTLRIGIPGTESKRGASASERSVTVALSPDGERLAVVAFDWIWIFDLASGSIRWHGSLGYEVIEPRMGLAKPGQHEVDSATVEALWFTETGDQLLACTRNGALWQWNSGDNNFKLVGVLKQQPLRARSILVERQVSGARIRGLDGTVLSTLSFDGELKAVSGDGRWLAVQRNPKEMNGPVYIDGFNPGDYSLELIEVQNGAVFRSFRNNASLEAVVFSPDNRLLAAEGSDGVVRVFRVDTGEEFDRIVLFEVGGHPPLFVNGSAALLTSLGTEPHEVAIWKLGPDQQVRDLCGKSVRNLSSAEWTDFLPGERPRETCALPSPSK